MREILILQTARLGDLAQTVPALRGLRRAHPEARLTLLAQPGPSALLEGASLFDRLVAVPYEAIQALEAPGRGDARPDSGPLSAEPALRETYDLLVNVSNDLGSAILCRHIAAGRKLGRIHTYDGEIRLLGDWSKYLYAMVAHRRENLFNLVDIQVGMAGLRLRPETVPLPVGEAARGEARRMLAAAGMGPGRKSGGARPLIALQAGASAGHRAWDLGHFAALGAALARDPGADLIVLGDPGERERCGELAAKLGGGREGAGPYEATGAGSGYGAVASPGRGSIANLAGRTTLRQLHALLGECDLLISNDTGPVHVAAAAGTATLGLFFSTAHYAETAPYGAGHAVLQVEIPCSPCDASSVCPVQKCRAHLPPEPVIDVARWLLSGAPEDAVPATGPGLSLYRSRFLADGSLAYLPARTGEASPHFQEALLGRLLWQDALGLTGDSALEDLAGSLRALGAFRSKREALAAAFAALEETVRRGRDLAAGLREEFASGEPVRERILGLHGSLAALGTSLAAAARSTGLCGTFLNFEMMDMDYVGYPALAGVLEDKYRRLETWLGRFRAALERLA